MTEKDRFVKFLGEYEVLCEKYGVIVKASYDIEPYLVAVDISEVAPHVDWLYSDADLPKKNRKSR